MNLDLIDPFRKTIDWLIEKYQFSTVLSDKKKLKKIGNQISKVASNNAVFVEILKKSLASKSDVIDVHTINTCIRNAQTDINVLNEIISNSELGISTYNFAFQHGLTELARLKQTTVSELKDKIAGNQSLEQTIQELEAYRLQWIELGNRIDVILKGKS